jgi:predicted permease
MNQDIRYALRSLRRSPGFTLVAMLTLAIGVGANTAIFSLINAVLFHSLPYRDPQRLVKVGVDQPGLGLRDVPFSFPEMQDLRTRAGVFEDLSVVFPASVNVTGAKEPERLELLGVGPNYFSMLGVRPQLGRLFGPQDVAPSFSQTVVISDGLWRRAYGADPRVLGKTLRLDNDMYTVVGVAPQEFRHPGRTVDQDVDIWAATGFGADPFPIARNARILPGAIARLQNGLTIAQARARLDAFASGLGRDFPTDYPRDARWTVRVDPLQDALVGGVRPMLLILLTAVFVIVVIASVNIANLQLARASERHREIAVRLALGATRARLVRQMLTESLLLSLTAGFVGLGAAAATAHLTSSLLPATIPRLQEVRIDATVLVAALALSVLSGVISGLAPALHAGNPNLAGAIREGSGTMGGGSRTSRLRSLLVAAEFTLAAMLLVGAGLLLKTLSGLLREDPGFNPNGVVTASVWLPVPNDPKTDKYAQAPARAAFVRETLRRASAFPGVAMTAMTSALPLSAPGLSLSMSVEGREPDPAHVLTVQAILVSPTYFQLLQVPLSRGRLFNDGDDAKAQRVALVDETTARLYFAGSDPLATRVRLGTAANAPWIAVVGIVKDVRHDGLDRDGVPHVYLPLYQTSGRSLSLLARTTLPAAALEAQIRAAIQGADPELPVFGVRSLTDSVDRSLAARRFSARLVGAFAAVALLVTTIGVYGLLAYLVTLRTRELGLRMALGARRLDIVTLVWGNGLAVAGAGILAGLLLAAVCTPAMRALLYGVRPVDPAVFVAVPLVLLSATLLASSMPALRATRVDPMTAFRAD